MKKILLPFIIAIFFLAPVSSFAQLTGTKYITSYNSHTADYASLAAAIADLNANGAGAGGVTFMMPPGYTETFVNGPAVLGPGVPTAYTITNGGVIITATGTPANPIIFQKDSYTSGVVTIKPGQGSTNNSDAILTINGGDNITFDGIDLQENTATSPAGNFVSSGTSIATAMLKFMEYGYYIINNGANGAQNNTIKNCTITLQNLNSVTGLSSYNSIAVYQNSNSGLNSGNTYQAITIVTAYKGIILNNSSGSDVGCKIQNCVIGSSGTIGSIGGTVQITSNAGQTYGIRGDNQSGIEVSGNTVQCVQYYRTTNNGETIGIYLNGTSGTCSVYKNNVNNVYNNYQASNATNCAIGMHMTLTSGIVYAYNNWVSKIAYTQSNGSASYAQTYGARFSGSGSVYFYYNSIYLSDQCASNTAALATSGVSLYSVNNIFKNYSTTHSSTSANRYHYQVFFGGGALASSNYNIFDIAGNSGYSQYFAGNYGGAIPANNISAFTTWQGTSPCTKDCNSKSFAVTFVSTTELHLKLTSCADDVNYQGTQITTGGGYPLNISTDIDGDIRNWPYMGADEVNLLTPNVLIASNQPVQNTVSKNDPNQVVASFIVTPYGGSTTFTGFSFNAGSTTSPYGYLYTTNSTNDFKNFKLWVDSTGGTTFTTSAPVYQLGSTQGSTPLTVGGSIPFSSGTYLPLSLTGCKSYTFYVTFDVGTPGTPVPPNARSGANINSTFTLADVGISSGTKYGTVGSSGYQYIADKYYNYPAVDVTREDSWYDATSFQQPNDFTSPYQTFQMIAIPVDTMAKAWTISNTLSKLIIGDGTNPLLFKSDSTYTGPVDVLNNATLKFQTQSIPSTLGILSTGSTVEYGEQRITPVYQNILAANYYNLKLSGSTSGTRVFPSGTAGVAGTFTPGSFTAASQGTISFNGTSQQTIPSFNYYNLNIANTSGITLNTTTGAGACKVDNGSTISITGGTGSLTYTAGNLCINGTLSNTYTGGQMSGLSNIQLGFGSTGYYNYNGSGSATNAYIPAATWNTASTAYVTGCGALTGNGVTAATPGGTGKFGNLIFHNPNLSGSPKFFGSNWGAGSPTTVNVGGNLTLGSLGSAASPLQITTGAACTFNIDGDLNVYAGNWGFATYAVTTNTYVLGNVNIDGSNATYSTSNPTLTLASSANTPTGNLYIGKNLTINSGTYTPSLTRTSSNGSANIYFNGSIAQTISSNLVGNMLTGAITTSISNNSGVTLTSGRYNPSTLTFTGSTAKFTVNSGTILVPANAIAGYNSSQYVITSGTGVLKHLVPLATGFVYPIGASATSYTPLTINYSNGATDSFAVNVSPTFIYAPLSPMFVVNTQYDITKHAGGSVTGSTLTMQWNTANEAAAFNRTLNPIVVGHYTGGAWTELSTNAAAGGSAGVWTTSVTGFTTFSPFAPGNCGAYASNICPTLLPVDLLSFSGKANGNISELAWKTTREINIKSFVIERGLDGSNFEGIGNVAAKNLSGQNEYGFDDRSVPLASIVYYRLKIVGSNGQYKYSQVIALNFKKGNGNIQIFPNPVKNILFITHDKASPGASVNIYSAVGCKIVEYSVVAGTMQTTLNTASFVAGVYLLRYENNGIVQVMRFTKF